MSLSVLRAIGTESLLKNTFRIPTMCLVSRNFEAGRMSSSKPNNPPSDDASLKTKSFGPSNGYSAVYRLPSAGKLAFINSSKHNQMKVLAPAAPVSMILTYFELISGDTAAVICVAGIVIALKLHLLSIFATNMIGFVYLSPDLSTVQISYIDHKGSRKDEFIPASDIVPLSETPRNVMEKFYSHIFRYSNKGSVPNFKLSLLFGEIINIKHFRHVFGNKI
ncbi:transmembrane protein 186 [Thrips palmi]|uniref:Transmembrane protein 186 n=1 Tax=Thrips palmi TaxID=161013 RepID=A0A6P8YYV6_THRPL|nr:transmembrane protein 186 [Thrips palmi]